MFRHLLSNSYVFKNVYLPILYILSHLFRFWNPFLPPPPSPAFLFLPHPRFHKLYKQSKSSLNSCAFSSSAVFCSNAALITTPSSSVKFFSFFYVLPSGPNTTGTTLMLLMFHILLILLISFFSSRYFSIFVFSFFTNSYVSRYSSISYGTTSFILVHYNNIWFPCLDLCITLDHSIQQNLHFFVFSNTIWNMLISFFTSFQVVFPTQFPMNYSCNIIVPSLVLLLPTFHIHSQHEIVSLFLSHILKSGYGTVLSIQCFTQFVRIACSCAAHNMASVSTFRSAFLCQYFFICCFWHFTYKLPIHSFVFPQFLLFPHPSLFEFLLIHCIFVFFCFCYFHAFNQWLN